MGRIKQGANGGFSGKAGSVIGSSWKEIEYIKGRPKVSNKPATQRQLEQQTVSGDYSDYAIDYSAINLLTTHLRWQKSLPQQSYCLDTDSLEASLQSMFPLKKNISRLCG